MKNDNQMILSKLFIIAKNLNNPQIYDIKHYIFEKYYTLIEVIAIIAKLIFQIKSANNKVFELIRDLKIVEIYKRILLFNNVDLKNLKLYFSC
jgi:hypothetical protein